MKFDELLAGCGLADSVSDGLRKIKDRAVQIDGTVKTEPVLHIKVPAEMPRGTTAAEATPRPRGEHLRLGSSPKAVISTGHGDQGHTVVCEMPHICSASGSAILLTAYAQTRVFLHLVGPLTPPRVGLPVAFENQRI